MDECSIQSHDTFVVKILFGKNPLQGDHWVHWPDHWFDQVRKSYEARYRQVKLDRKRILHFKRRRTSLVAHAAELRPGWSKHAWMNPLQKVGTRLEQA